MTAPKNYKGWKIAKESYYYATKDKRNLCPALTMQEMKRWIDLEEGSK